MKLIPLSDDGEEIVFPKFLKKCRIGRAEIKNALAQENSKEKAEKVSKSAVDIQIRNDTLSVINIGKNSIFTGCFGMPLERLVPDEKRDLSFGDVIGFRQDALVFRIEVGSSRKIDKPEVAVDIENKDQGTLSDNAEWTSGSISDHQNGNIAVDVSASHQNLPIASRRRRPCEYGGGCYRQNPTHKIEFSHPGDDDWWDPLNQDNTATDFEDQRPECQYGILCYQNSEVHRRKYQHSTAGSAPKRRAARRAEERNREISSDSDDLLRESESEVEYDVSEGEEDSSRPAKIQKMSSEARDLISETKKLLRDRNF
ncbi:unnamed protein product [Oikopleura dioica]|uniref:PBZ-type domain-containing protein n=1 Tax=Oikopleura dioica TaxID=34765 RepID=E4YKV8_OIKDI|nr:unnamed protein product [Oikopleura dioica]